MGCEELARRVASMYMFFHGEQRKERESVSGRGRRESVKE